jgi:hypothetical protein
MWHGSRKGRPFQSQAVPIKLFHGTDLVQQTTILCRPELALSGD